MSDFVPLVVLFVSILGIVRGVDIFRWLVLS